MTQQVYTPEQIKRAAKISGLSRSTIAYRIRKKGMTLAEAMKKKLPKKPKNPLVEKALHQGVKPNTAYQRMLRAKARGLPVDDSVTAPVDGPIDFDAFDQKIVTFIGEHKRLNDGIPPLTSENVAGMESTEELVADRLALLLIAGTVYQHSKQRWGLVGERYLRPADIKTILELLVVAEHEEDRRASALGMTRRMLSHDDA